MEAKARIEIAASIDRVWRVMTRFERYLEWNPFIAGIRPLDKRDPVVGTALELDVRWEGGGKTKTIEIISRLEDPSASEDGTKRAAMEYRFTGLIARLSLVNGSRLQTITQAPGGPTVYETREQFTGLLKLGVPLKKVQRGFELHAQGLKKRAENPSDYYCIRCGAYEVVSTGMDVHNGNVTSPASDTDITVDYGCEACGAYYYDHAHHSDPSLHLKRPLTRPCPACARPLEISYYGGRSKQVYCSECRKTSTL